MFFPGLPASVSIYKQAGDPSTLTPYPSGGRIDTVTAGSVNPLFAKIFDRNLVWLSNYETVPANDAFFTWTVSVISGDTTRHDTLISKTGHTTSFTPTNAYATYAVTVHFAQDTISRSATLLFYVNPSTINHLVIEASSSPTGVFRTRDNPLADIDFGSTDTLKYAYAVLRDQFGNFISPAQTADWRSFNASVVTVGQGVVAFGQGKIVRVGTVDSTQVTAFTTSGPSLADSVWVRLLSFSYDSLRIVVRDSIIINSLTMRDDQDTTLQVQGKRSTDKKWVPVNADWTYTSNNGSSNSPSASSWHFVPLDTAAGIIYVKMGTAVPYTITVTVLPGLPSKLALYPKAGRVPDVSNNPYQDPATLPQLTDSAGTPFPLVAKMFDRRGVWLQSYETNTAPIKWSIKEIAGPLPTPTGALSTDTGYASSFTGTKAQNSVYLVATSVQNGTTLCDSVSLMVIAGAANHLTLQSDTASVLKWIDLASVQMPSTVDTLRNLYTIVRDKSNNFISYAANAQWSSGNSAIVNALSFANQYGQGEAIRATDNNDSTMIYAKSSDGNLTDSLQVKLSAITYTTLRIYTGSQSSHVAIDTLYLQTDQAKTVFVEGLRSDGRGWQNISANWAKTGTIKIQGLNPGLSDRWLITADSVGSGMIIASLTGATSDTVQAIFLSGGPGSVSIYKQTGNPSSLTPYLPSAQVDTVVAGRISNPLFAKIFDRNSIWLSAYETSSDSAKFFTWNVKHVAGPTSETDTLSATTGPSITFRPVKAYTQYLVIVNFANGKFTESDSVAFYVKPAAANHLVLEANPAPVAAALLHDTPLAEIDFGARDTLMKVYAVLRDQFGNFTGDATDARWKSFNTVVATAAAGDSTKGQGLVHRVGVVDSTKVMAYSAANNLLADTANVKLLNFAWDSLRIVVNDSTPIKGLTMSDNQDTLLKVQGLRSFDGKWTAVSGSWKYSSDNGSSTNPTALQWEFGPVDTATGNVVVTLGDSSTATITVKIVAGPPAKLVLYKKPGAPASADTLPGLSTTITDSAGAKFTLYAKYLTARGSGFRNLRQAQHLSNGN